MKLICITRWLSNSNGVGRDNFVIWPDEICASYWRFFGLAAFSTEFRRWARRLYVGGRRDVFWLFALIGRWRVVWLELTWVGYQKAKALVLRFNVWQKYVYSRCLCVRVSFGGSLIMWDMDCLGIRLCLSISGGNWLLICNDFDDQVNTADLSRHWRINDALTFSVNGVLDGLMTGWYYLITLA